MNKDAQVGLLAILTAKVMNEAYVEVRRNVPRDAWQKMSREEKVKLCTATIERLLARHNEGV